VAVAPNANKYPNVAGDGLKLFVHNKSFTPKITEEINLKMGREVNVMIKRTDSHKTPYPYSECRDFTRAELASASLYYRVLRAANRNYRQYDCYKLCLQELIIEKCGCYFTKYLSITSETRACFNLTELNCVYAQIAAFVIDEACSRLCPLECDTVTYDILTTNLVFPE